METRLVLVERQDKDQRSLLTSSALMVNTKYVITTANLFADRISEINFDDLKPGVLYTPFPTDGIDLNVVWTDEELYSFRKATIFSSFVSHNIKNSDRMIFKQWAIDSVDNNRDVNKTISLFFVLTLDGKVDEGDFKDTLRRWWDLVARLNISKGSAICIKSAPFGNRHFMNSMSLGIVSNVFGNSSCLILSDCPSSPGSEGSPVYLYQGGEIPIGLVLSSLSWWRGEWIGLTLIADIRAILSELIGTSMDMVLTIPKTPNSGLIDTLEFSLVQVSCGGYRGTAILLSKEKGIFITNSHVTENPESTLHHKDKSFRAHVVYKTPKNEVFDIAVLKTDPKFMKDLKLKSIPVANKLSKPGDVVFSAGFPLFRKECNIPPTLSRGCISQVHPYMIKTTCCVNAGSSGGAILDCDGALVGIVVCNAKLISNNLAYPRINMSIPYSAIAGIMASFIETEDPTILKKIHIKDKQTAYIWKILDGKL